MQLNSFIIKTALMQKYRFRHQCACIDEVYTGYGEFADLVVDTGTEIWEIEIKTSKSDLWRGEAVKKKHKGNDLTKFPNKYYICVPTELLDEARKWVEETNLKYGIMEFKSEIFDRHGYSNWRSYCYIDKRAKYLNKGYSNKLHEDIIRRLSSVAVNGYERIIFEMKQKELNVQSKQT